MAFTLPAKDPTEEKPYGVDWADFLIRENTTINNVSWSDPEPNTIVVDNAGITDGQSRKEQPGQAVPDSVTYAWFRGGVAGTRSNPSRYSVRVTITTAGGITQVERIIVPVANK